jgi:hypothetical protein
MKFCMIYDSLERVKVLLRLIVSKTNNDDTGIMGVYIRV